MRYPDSAPPDIGNRIPGVFCVCPKPPPNAVPEFGADWYMLSVALQSNDFRFTDTSQLAALGAPKTASEDRMRRYGDVAHIPISARITSAGRWWLLYATARVRRLIPGTSKGHAVLWEPRRGWVIRPASGLRTLAWLPPVAATTAYARDDSDSAGTWAMQVLGIE